MYYEPEKDKLLRIGMRNAKRKHNRELAERRATLRANLRADKAERRRSYSDPVQALVDAGKLLADEYGNKCPSVSSEKLSGSLDAWIGRIRNVAK